MVGACRGGCVGDEFLHGYFRACGGWVMVGAKKTAGEFLWTLLVIMLLMVLIMIRTSVRLELSVMCRQATLT